MVLGSEILWQNSNDTGFRTISRNVENLSADKFAKFSYFPALENYF